MRNQPPPASEESPARPPDARRWCRAESGDPQDVLGASWQRCRVHYIGNLLAVIPKASQD
jgi:hypothetical protein